VVRSSSAGGRAAFDVESNASAYLVVRDSHARGWRAAVDGVSAPVLRANGKHRAVAVPAGRHEVLLEYHPPGLRPGLALFALSVLLCAAAWMVAERPGRA
jgi:uncharacterized membrane protein YfhO